MKKLVLILSSLLVLTSCGNTNSDNSIKQELKNNQLAQMLEENQVILNLTPNGLYNGTKGNNLENYYVENGLLLTLNMGDILPDKDEITSSVKDNEFAGWAYINDEDETISYTTFVIEGIKMYHATWNYTGDYSDIGNQTSQTTTSTTTSNPTTDTTTNTDTTSSTSINENLETIYFIDQGGWNDYAAATGIYLFDDDNNPKVAWPGEAMSIAKEYDSTLKRNVWSFEVDVSIYNNLIFVRGEVKDGTFISWNKQTVDIKYEEGKNAYLLCETGDVSNGDEKATVTSGVWDNEYGLL